MRWQFPNKCLQIMHVTCVVFFHKRPRPRSSGPRCVGRQPGPGPRSSPASPASSSRRRWGRPFLRLRRTFARRFSTRSPTAAPAAPSHSRRPWLRLRRPCARRCSTLPPAAAPASPAPFLRLLPRRQRRFALRCSTPPLAAASRACSPRTESTCFIFSLLSTFERPRAIYFKFAKVSKSYPTDEDLADICGEAHESQVPRARKACIKRPLLTAKL